MSRSQFERQDTVEVFSLDRKLEILLLGGMHRDMQVRIQKINGGQELTLAQQEQNLLQGNHLEGDMGNEVIHSFKIQHRVEVPRSLLDQEKQGIIPLELLRRRHSNNGCLLK